MIIGKLRKSGNSFIVTVPRDEVERLELHEGDLVMVQVNAVDVRARLRPGLRDAFEVEFREGQEALRYLAQ